MRARRTWWLGVGFAAVLLAQQAASQASPQFMIAPRYEALAGRPMMMGIQVAIGRVDANDSPDVVLSSGLNLLVHLNRGDGTFAWTFVKAPPLLLLTGFGLADIDGDGDADVVVPSWGRKIGPFLVYLNDGNGKFVLDASGKRIPTPPAIGLSVALGDLDGDGDVDLVVGSQLAQNRLYLNDGKGFFKDVTSTHLPGDTDYTNQIVLADLDGDGDLDMVAANTHLVDRNAVYFNDGKARFTWRRLPAPWGNASSVAVGDVDRDGDPDLVFVYVERQDRLYLNDGKGGFRDATHLMPFDKDWSNHVVLGDVDGDGDQDIVAGTGRGATPGPRIYLNDGKGRFTNQTRALMPFERPGANLVGLRDFDGDGDLDLLVNGGWMFRRDPNGLKVFVNLRRQVYTQPRVVAGGPLGLSLHGNAGEVAYAILGLDRARIQLGSLGTLGVDPRTGVALPPVLLPRSRQRKLSFSLPPDPRLRGRTLYTQALMLDPANLARSHLTNWLVDPIR